MRTNHRSIRTLLAGALAAGSVALVMPASPVQAADIDLTIVDADGDPIERAMIAFVDADGAALVGAIADENGDVTIDNTGAAGYVASAPGYETLRVDSAPSAGTVTLIASGTSSLSYSNAYGAQVQSVFADAEPGVFYILTDGIPTMWRSMDYAGTWAPVPTLASSEDGLPQQGAGGLATSGYPGEVALYLGNAIWYSRDFGTTWDSITVPNGTNLAQPEVRWAHSVGSASESSVLLVASMPENDPWNTSGMYLIEMPTSDISPTPTFPASNVASVLGAGNKIVDLVGTGGLVQLIASDTTGTQWGAVSFSGAGWSWATAGNSETVDMKFSSAPSVYDSLEASALGTDQLMAIVMYDQSGSGNTATANMRVMYDPDGVGASVSQTSMVGPATNNFDGSAWGAFPGFNSYCGENSTGTAISIGPDPAGAFADFELVGSVGSCLWAYNLAGTEDWPTTTAGAKQVGANQVGIVPIDGINNNTGFAWSGGYDWTNDMVAISKNEFGVAKASDVSYRPNFSRAPRDRNGIISSLAQPGTGDESAGVAIVGLTAAVVRDIVMDPNDATGDSYALISSPTGGARVMLTTDGGESFSTLAGSGGETLAWWNSADGLEFMAYFASLNDNELMVKPFTRESGTGPAQMAEELAADGADRELDANGFGFSANGLRAATAVYNGSRSYVAALASGNAAVSAMAGVTGTNYVLVGGSTIQSGGGSVNAVYSAGSVGLMELAVDSSNAVTVDEYKVYGGSGTTGQDPTAADTRGLYTNGGVTSITYCPVGSGAAVADKAFITVKGASGGGLYVLSNVSSGSPTHAPIAAAAALGLGKLRVDCATGLLAAVAPATQSNPPQPGGVYISTDAATFVQMNLPIQPSTLDVQADEATGEITMVVAGGNGDVTSVEMTEEDLGIDLTDVKAGDETTPAQPVDPPEDGVTPLNESEDGINTGGVADIELPPSDGDVALEENIGAASVRRSVKALADDVPVSIGSASGAFASSVGAASTGGTGGGSTFVPLTPARILDTRNAVGAPAARVGALDGSGAPLELTVAGKGGVPATGIGAVALNVTVVDGQANDFGGFVTVYPCGTRPDSSNLNFVSGQTIPNSVIAPVSSSGTVCFYVYGTANLLADVSGYLPSGFTPLTPARILDTRNAVGAPAARVGAIDGSGSALELTVAGKGGVPSSGVDAVALNVTVVDGEANDFGGFVTVYPCGTRPDSSNLNFVSGQTIPNSVIAPVSSSGTVCFYVYGTANLLADVSGYFASGFTQLTPARILDTRNAVGAPAARVGAIDGSGSALELTVAGKGGVPSTGVDAVALNVTVVDGQANDFGGFVTVYPCGTRPDSSNLNFVSGQTIPNSVIAPVSSSGTVCFYVYGTANLLADVSGYFGG